MGLVVSQERTLGEGARGGGAPSLTPKLPGPGLGTRWAFQRRRCGSVAGAVPGCEQRLAEEAWVGLPTSQEAPQRGLGPACVGGPGKTLWARVEEGPRRCLAGA